MKLLCEETSSLLEMLVKLSPDSSKTTLRSWLNKGRITVNGDVVKNGSTPIEKGSTVALLQKVEKERAGIEVLYEDADVVVIEKPAGLLTVATDRELETHAHAFIKRRHPGKKVYPVHRLDRETSGIMVFTLNEKARDNLKDQFYHHTILREYHAKVEGKLSGKGTWKSQLIEDANYHVHATNKGGKDAVTHYEVIKKSRHTTLLRVTLETGRKNQIRVHCAEAGHPVVGDRKYGANNSPYGRLCLHAAKLAFKHPTSGKLKLFTSRRILP